MEGVGKAASVRYWGEWRARPVALHPAAGSRLGSVSTPEEYHGEPRPGSPGCGQPADLFRPCKTHAGSGLEHRARRGKAVWHC